MKTSLVSIIFGGYLALNYQVIAWGKIIKYQSSANNQRENHQSSIPTKLLLASTASTAIPSKIKQEPIFNPIEPTPFQDLRYVVYIDSDNSLLLVIIRQQIEPRAVLRNLGGRRVIQVGSFSKLFFALDLLDYLEEKGINGRLARLEPGEVFGEPVAPGILAASVYPPVLHPIAYGLNNIESYYVLIPSKSKDLALITYKLQLLGVPEQGILVTEIPENVAIGPFQEREAARKWRRYLLDSGFVNVVIYFGR